IYSLTSSIYSNNQPGADIDFTSSPVQAVPSGVAGAFNVFDIAEYAESYIENLTSQPAPLNLTLYWAAGEGTTGSKYYDLNGHIYLCGTSDDDDSYDDVVILHEIGHYIHLSYSGSPDYYGGHSLAGIYDLRLGFTEGVGTYFAGAIRNYMGVDQPLIYIETTGTSLRFVGFSMASNTDIIAGYSSSTFTALDAGNEATVGHVIFEVVDGASTNDGSMGTDDDSIDLPNMQGDQMVFDVFVAIKDNESTLSVVNGKRISLETFYDYWVILHPSYASAFQQILLDHMVEYQEDAMEPDNSTSAATWIETDGSTYHHTYFPAGDADWSKFNGSAGTEYLIKTRNLGNGADTILQIYDTDGTTLLAENDDESSSSWASAIQFNASADATYYIRTNRSTDAIPIGEYGDFDLTIYNINHPSITSLSPSIGSVNGGYSVNITGDNFESGATVKFGVYTTTDVTWNSATSMSVTAPANVPGLADITIFNAVTEDGIITQGTLQDGFEYTGSPLPPSIYSITPDFGDYSGSTEVTITGDYLIDGLTTSFGSNILSSLTVVDAKTIQATVQSVPRGVHTVTVANPGGDSSSIVNGFESTLTDIATVGSTFVSGSPLQNTITITEDVRMSDLYVHVNVSHPIVPAKLNLTLETPSGKMIALFDEIQVATEALDWRSGFDSIFGYDEAPSEALYQLKGESSLGDWILHASSSSSSTNTLHSWGVTFLEYRHRDHGVQVYCAAEYRNHVMSVDADSGDLLFRSRYEGTYGNAVSISNDGRKLFNGGSSYHDGNSWENSLIHVNDAWTGELLDSYLLSGRADSGSMAETPNGNLVVVTSSQLYLIDLANKSIIGNLSLEYYATYNTYDLALNPLGTIAYVTNKDGSTLQTYNLPSLTSAGNLSTGSFSPSDVIISSDGSFGAIAYNEDIIQLFHTSNLSVFATHTADTGKASITFNSDDTEIYGGIFTWYAGFMHLDLQSGTLTIYPVDGASHGVYALGDRIYIADWGNPSMIVWDAVEMERVREIDLAPYDGYSCRDITAAEPPGMLSPDITASSSSLTLSWAAPSSGPAVTEYRVYKGDSLGNESFYSSVSSSTLTYTDTSVVSGLLSHYRVSAVMQGLGEGPLSRRSTCYAGAVSDGDLDSDGICDDADEDADGDGVANSEDAFPLDSSEDTDTDGDGTGNNADTDDDDDGWSDADELVCNTDALDSTSIPADADSDGICDEVDTDRAEAGFQSGSVFTDATLSARGGTTCAVLESASLQCWGSNAASKLGSGSGGSTPATSDLGSGRTAVATAIGFYN
ncbi:IPT/TIG domain-containing protein, partial [Candidatus Thalassarchaeum betae]|uniref:IPT/TIG domain-containing protein n=1 Tax=Candidatus Thalassarchaeum betae TaxID=2599289 RepID=UPI0030C75CA2|nr:IPT/TIG domain-containing protein [Candidatus Thalassoarchaea betae]